MVGLRFGKLAVATAVSFCFGKEESEPPQYHKDLIAVLTESPKPLGKRARRRLRGRLKQEKRNGNA